MRFVGVDLAARPKNTSLCILEWNTNPRVEAVHRPADDESIIRIACENVAAVGLDSPFGWPQAFVSFIRQGLKSSHQPAPLTDKEADRLKFRTTDRWLREQKIPATGNKIIRPLSVATDKLGAVALRCVRLLQCLTAQRGDRQTIYEVYPAASLARWTTLKGSYKTRGPDSRQRRRDVIELLVKQGLDVGVFGKTLTDSHDDLDALVSALTAALALKGLTEPPPQHLVQLSSLEGWIHVPSGSLPDLASLDLT